MSLDSGQIAAINSDTDQAGRRFAAISAIVLSIPCAILFASALMAGKDAVLGGPDTVSQVVPWFQFEAQAFRSGRVPLWNPHYFCGSPFVGNLQSACFYPPHWIIPLLPLALCINLLFIAHFF